MGLIRLALNADTTPLSISDTLMFKPLTERAREAYEAGFPAVNVDRSEEGMTAERAAEIVGDLGLMVASGFFHGHFHREEEAQRILADAKEQAEFSRAIGQKCLFVSAYVFVPERHARVGRIRLGEGPSLTDEEFERMARLLERIGRLWADYGIELCFHPHVATYVEATHEVERLLQLTDPRWVKLGPDTGHLYFGGSDPMEIVERYLPRVSAIHIKDVRREIVERVRREELDYRRACALGVWTELGKGAIDFPALFRLLRERGWSGWVIVETDHTELESALESSKVSRRYLKEVLGL